MTEAEIDSRRRPARLLGTLIAVTAALQLIQPAITPLEGDGSRAWMVVSLVAFIGGVALLWRANPPWTAAFVLIMVGIAASTLGTFGDDEFTRMVLAACAGILALYAFICYVVFPIMLRIRGRWPVAGPSFTPVTDTAALAGNEQPVAPALMQRVDALMAIGFTPRARNFVATSEGRADSVVFLHASLPIFGLAARLAMPRRTTELVQLSIVPPPGETARCTVVDALAPDPFPLQYNDRVYLFPDTSPAQLLDIVQRLSPTPMRVPRMPSPEELIDFISNLPDVRLHFLLTRGYLDSNVIEGAHRFTWKGALVAASRSLWPGSAIIRWRRRRAAEAALRAAAPVA